jgi:hypothetical protein
MDDMRLELSNYSAQSQKRAEVTQMTCSEAMHDDAAVSQLRFDRVAPQCLEAAHLEPDARGIHCVGEDGHERLGAPHRK